MRTYEDVQIMVLRNDVQGLIRAASDADETIRLEAVKALKALNPPEAREVLMQAQNDSSPKVRRAVMLDQSMRGVAVSGERKDKQDSLRWLWILLGTWGVSSILLSLLISVLVFSNGNFDNSSSTIGILVFGVGGIVLLWLAVLMLKKKNQ